MTDPSPDTGEPLPGAGPRELLLLSSVFVVAVAGLVYELIAGTLSTYLLGSSVTVFSIVIGIFLSAMGLGAWLAQYVHHNLVRTFVLAEVVLGLLGGTSALALFWAFAWMGDGYEIALGVSCILTGALVGLEIPLLLRILEQKVDVRVAVSHVLALDYAGALVASLLFPLLLLPHLGLVRSGALFGLINIGVAALALRTLGDDIPRPGSIRAATAGAGLILLAVLAGGGQATTWIEDRLYADPVLMAKSSPYQRIVVTRWRDDVRLYLEGHLQFSSADEYRYHESLVHPVLSAANNPARVLILGGGDGMAVREALKNPRVKHIDLVDLDPEVTRLFTEQPELAKLNGGALTDPRVTVHHADAFAFVEQTEERWDAIIADLPDPNDAGLARLYSLAAFRMARRRLTDSGAMVTQATSPFYAPDAFWCIARTLEMVATEGAQPMVVHPYTVPVPSFGQWGFVLMTRPNVDPRDTALPPDTRYLNAGTLDALFALPNDMQPREVEVNRLQNGVLARYYRRGWGRYNGP